MRIVFFSTMLSLSNANSASLTFVPTDFVRKGSFREHRLIEISEEGHARAARRSNDSEGGLRFS